ncbi:MAG TPA: phytanoyl-CoA dioxygenase family protein [Planctomycetaceae bacterium]|nr:phytanoyl-CoA dioxygenase family protein [Planctomycetaceae bacterium]HQZ67775.1 phytanoyl-CoA dioxygenase family protein [Planctomycetaceae bacterium]
MENLNSCDIDNLYIGVNQMYGHGLQTQLAEQGFVIIDRCLPLDVVHRMLERIEVARQQVEAQESVSNMSGVYALRNLTDVVPEVVELLSLPGVVSLVAAILGDGAFLVRSTLFDKTDGANWGVFWHQDLSIAVKERHEIEGYHAWTRKAGVQCVQPPLEVMSRILAVRLHLDDCKADNGALKVLPESHRQPQLTSDRIEQITAVEQAVVCEVPVGGAVLMNPLLLHASSPMNIPGHRRVIHFEFAAMELPPPLEWRYRIPCGAV